MRAAPLTIADTLSNLLDLGSASLAHNNAVLQATPIALSADTVATVAQMAALAALPEYAQFSRNGHTLTVADTGRHLAGFTPDGVTTATAYVHDRRRHADRGAGRHAGRLGGAT